MQQQQVALYNMALNGNVIPHAWYTTILKEDGKPDLQAITILAEIVYWYRPVEDRDPETGAMRGLRSKLKSNRLRMSYAAFSERFGLTKRQATEAVIRLEKHGLITRHFVSDTIRGTHLVNILELELHVDRLKAFTDIVAAQSVATYPPNTGGVSQKSGTPLPKIRDTSPENPGHVLGKYKESIGNKNLNDDQAAAPQQPALLQSANPAKQPTTAPNARSGSSTPKSAPQQALTSPGAPQPVSETVPVSDIQRMGQLLASVGVMLDAYTVERYVEMAVTYGWPAVETGLKAAADMGKQRNFKYVVACIENALGGDSHVSQHNSNGKQQRQAGSHRGGPASGSGPDSPAPKNRHPDKSLVDLYN